MSDRDGNVAGMTLAERTELELRLLHGRTAGASPQVIPRRAPSGDVPVSFAQQRLWFLDQLDPGASTYNIARRIRMRGVLDLEALGRSLDAVVARHETLRTSIVVVDGVPTQVIAPALSLALPVTDLTTDPERELTASRLATEEVRRPFELARGPLFRASLLRLAPTDHLLVLVVHHIISDAWSMGVLFREIGTLYRALVQGESSPLPALAIQYADYAIWQQRQVRGENLERQLSYWRERLRNIPPALDLPTDHPYPPAQSTRGAKQSIVVPRGVSDGLSVLSRREGVTLFTTLLAAFQSLLGRYSGQKDVVVGSPIAGRTQAETEGLVGFFVNTLAFRADLSGDPSFRDLLGRAREMTLGAYAHQDLPFEQLVEELQPERDTRRTPVFQVAFAFQNMPHHKLELPGLTLQSEPAEIGTAKFELMLYMWQRADGLRAVLEYNVDLFEAATIARMLSHFQVLLQGIVLEPGRRLSELPLLEGRERHQLIEEWNRTATDYPAGQCIHELFEEQVARTPNAVAVESGDIQLTYQQLESRANRLASCLRARGVGPDIRVGICLERSPDLVIGLLAILKAGGTYVPLDPSYPRARLGFVLDDAQVRVLLTERAVRDALPAPERTVLVSLDQEHEVIARAPDAPISSGVTPDHLAYVIYTSGSTGTPKGVAVTHGNGVAFLSWARATTPPAVGRRVLATTSISFDLSVYELFGTLSWGGTVLLAANALALPSSADPALAPTLLNTVPSAAAALVRLGAIPTGLARVNLAGESPTLELVEQLYAAGVPEVYNLYGPTETTVYSTGCSLAGWGAGPPSIGRPIANTRAYVLDRRLEPVPIGVPGELFLGGPGVARGYVGRPGLTAERFVPDPFGDGEGARTGARLYRTGDRVRWLADGTLEFLGRLDHQLKLRGFRIEPGEIESLLRSHPSVRAAVVSAREDVPGDPSLVAYLVLNGTAADPTVIRRFLGQQLPEYMVPSSIVVMEALPLAPNGKVDRRALPAPDSAAPPGSGIAAVPRTAAEEALVKIWQEILRVESVGVDQNFFALGGHSLLATRVMSRVREALGVDVPLRAFFEAPTVEALALRVEAARQAAPTAAVLPLRRVSRDSHSVGAQLPPSADRRPL